MSSESSRLDKKVIVETKECCKFSEALQSEREYWSQLCLTQVGQVEVAMKEKLRQLELALMEKARQCAEASAAEMHDRLSRSVMQEMEVQREELEVHRYRPARTRAATDWRDAGEPCADRIAALEAVVEDLRETVANELAARASLDRLLSEQRREIAGLRDRCRSPAEQAVAPSAAPSPAPRSLAGSVRDIVADFEARSKTDLDISTRRSESSACPSTSASLPSEALASAEVSPSPTPSSLGRRRDGAVPSHRHSGRATTVHLPQELPRLLGRALSPPPRTGSKTPQPASSKTPGGITRDLEQTLKQVVSAVQKTLGDIDDQGPHEQYASTTAPPTLTSTMAQAQALTCLAQSCSADPTVTAALPPLGARTPHAALPPLSARTPHAVPPPLSARTPATPTQGERRVQVMPRQLPVRQVSAPSQFYAPPVVLR